MIYTNLPEWGGADGTTTCLAGITLLVGSATEVGMVSICDDAVMFPFISTATVVVAITRSVSESFVFIWNHDTIKLVFTYHTVTIQTKWSVQKLLNFILRVTQATSDYLGLWRGWVPK